MAFVYHDYVEIAGRIVLEEKGCIHRWLFSPVIRGSTNLFVAERLVRGDDDLGIFLRVARVDLRRVVAECRLEIAEAIVSKFGPVADKKSFAHKAGIEDAPQHSGGDPRLSGPGGDWNE